MNKVRFTALIVIITILTGCTPMESSTFQETTGEDQNITPSAGNGRIVKLPDQSPKNRIPEDPIPTPETPKVETPQMQIPATQTSVLQTPVAQTPPYQPGKGQVLDFRTLDALPNKQMGWGVALNKQHQPPAVSEYTEKLFNRYGGIYLGNPSKKEIYLTFDEGYELGYTGTILDTLKDNQVKTIFFVTGPYIEKNPDLVQRMIDEGHKVGNHTINHPSLPSVDNIALEKELWGLEERFENKFGVGFEYMRPPKGEYSEKVLAAAQQLGYKTVFWSFAYLDYDVNNQKGADYAYNKVMDHLHNGAVLLLHAVSKDNAQALDRMIKGIQEQGYEIRPFDL